jgi:hypothetical protein
MAGPFLDAVVVVEVVGGGVVLFEGVEEVEEEEVWR